MRDGVAFLREDTLKVPCSHAGSLCALARGAETLPERLRPSVLLPSRRPNAATSTHTHSSGALARADASTHRPRQLPRVERLSEHVNRVVS